METTVEAGGKRVRFVSSAAMPLDYRAAFGKDLLREMNAVSNELRENKEKESGLPVHALTVFINMAYIMARAGDPLMTASSPSEWLEAFPPLFMYEVIPVVQALWAGNLERVEESKKKVGRLTEILQQPSSRSAPSSLESHLKT